MQLQSLLFVLVQVKAIVKYGQTHAENDYRTTYVITVVLMSAEPSEQRGENNTKLLSFSDRQREQRGRSWWAGLQGGHFGSKEEEDEEE